MRPKSVLVLFVIVVALLAFIWFYERQLPSSDERGELAKKAIVFDADAVNGIELEWEGRRVHLVRAPRDSSGEEDDEALGFFEDEWRLEEPLEGWADIDLINGLLNDLGSLERLRELDDMDASRAGLDPPRATVLLHTDAGVRQFRVGSEVPASETVIVSVDEEDLFVVSNSFWSSLSHEPGDWRSKDLYLGDREDIESVTLQTATTRVRLARRGEAFWIEDPLVDRADRERVRDLLGSVLGLRVDSFVDELEVSLADFGLEPPVSNLEVSARDGQQLLSLDWGRPVPEGEARFFARVDGQVFETSARLAEFMDVRPEEWRSRALTTFETYQIDSVRVLDNQGELMLQRAGADWNRNGEQISFTAVSDLLYSLVDAKASGFQGSGEAGVEAEGRAEPELEVTLSGADREETLTLGAATGEVVPARSSAREVVLLVAPDVVEQIQQRLEAVRAAAPIGSEDFSEKILESGDEAAQDLSLLDRLDASD